MKSTFIQIFIDVMLLACAGATIYLIYLIWNIYPGPNTASLIIYPLATIIMILVVIWPMYKFRKVLFHYKKFYKQKLAEAEELNQE